MRPPPTAPAIVCVTMDRLEVNAAIPHFFPCGEPSQEPLGLTV